MDYIAAATASAKSWTKLAEGLEAEAAPFAPLTEIAGQELLADLLYTSRLDAAAEARIAAARDTSRAA